MGISKTKLNFESVETRLCPQTRSSLRYELVWGQRLVSTDSKLSFGYDEITHDTVYS